MSQDFYFTAPWDNVAIRRGDALGLRAGADYFADLIAPGLSNGTSDARWITLLSWCLKWSHIVWCNAGGGNLTCRDGQRARYAWLRPLELLWVDRTLESGQMTGQLRGRRSIERWRNANCKLSNIGMNPDQFRRYRQVGTYGAYRVVFRTVADLTEGDGWTPAKTALKLADLVNQKLPQEAQLRDKRFERVTKWGIWRDQETRFWTERGWREWRTKADHGFLPTPDNAVRKPLSKDERRILEPALFSTDSVRRVTAEVLASANACRSHSELCDALANSTKLELKLKPASLVPFPAFTRLADAAMHAMRVLWKEIIRDEENQAPVIEKIARSSDLQEKFQELRKASETWCKTQHRNTFPHNQTVTRLAETMFDVNTPKEQIQALTKYHQENGGGRRWFREQAGKLMPLVADTGIATSDYRFRLRSICLLAAQCGVADMNAALDAISQHDANDDEGEIL